MLSLRARLHIAAALAAVPLFAIAARLVQLQVLERKDLTAKVLCELRASKSERILRGRILDRNGYVLAESLPSWSVSLDPQMTRGRESDFPSLAAALRIPPQEVRRKARGSGRSAMLKRQLGPDELEAVKALKLPFVAFTPDERRAYPNEDLAASLLGSVGADGKGLSGLELEYDRALSGKLHNIALLRDGKGHTMALGSQDAPESPPDLTLTIDRGLQHYAEAALAEAVERNQPLWGAVVIEDPSNGEILAMASNPPDPLKSRIFQQVYEPGSTFKTVTAAAALGEKLTHPGEEIDCTGPWALTPHVTIKDHEPEGILPLELVMAHSSNIGMAKLGLRLGGERLYRYARAFGFGARTGVRFPGESAGLLKPRSSKDRVGLATNAFGQGLAVTPLQLVNAYAAVANGGELLEPRVVRAVGASPAPKPTVVRRVASPETIRLLNSMLEGVVLRGTGMSAAIPGYSTAGKTGTSQKLDPATRHYSSTDYIASFAGYVPSRRPRFVIAVILDSPRHQYYGSEVAAPVFAKLAREALALYGVPPDKPLLVRPDGAPAAAPRAAVAAPKAPAARAAAPRTR